MKLGGNLPLGHNALFFLITGTGSRICPVAQTRWTYQGFWFPIHGPLGGESQSAPAQGRFEALTCRSTVEHANHQTTMTALDLRWFSQTVRQNVEHVVYITRIMILVRITLPCKYRYTKDRLCHGIEWS